MTISDTRTELPSGYRADYDIRYVEDLPTLNWDLLHDLLAWARHDEALADRFAKWPVWNQGLWGGIEASALLDFGLDYNETDAGKAMRNGVCGSAACMAGNAAVQSGYRLILQSGSASQCIAERDTGLVDERGLAVWEDVPGAAPRMIHDVGQEVIGLTDQEGNRFFEGDNRIDRLHELANLFCVVRGLPLVAPDYEIGPLYEPYDEDDDEDDEDYDDDED